MTESLIFQIELPEPISQRFVGSLVDYAVSQTIGKHRPEGEVSVGVEIGDPSRYLVSVCPSTLLDVNLLPQLTKVLDRMLLKIDRTKGEGIKGEKGYELRGI